MANRRASRQGELLREDPRLCLLAQARKSYNEGQWAFLPSCLEPFVFSWIHPETPKGYQEVYVRFRAKKGCMSQPYTSFANQQDVTKFAPQIIIWKGEPTTLIKALGTEKLAWNSLPRLNHLDWRTAAGQPQPSGSSGATGSTTDSDPAKNLVPKTPLGQEKVKRASARRKKTK